MQKISSYISIISLLLVINLPLRAEETEPVDSIPLWNGLRLELDVASPLFHVLQIEPSQSIEGGVYLNLKQRYLPLFEMGFAGLFNKISPQHSVFSADGLFFRTGLDINLLNAKKRASNRNLVVAGFRVGASSFSYDLRHVLIEDKYWQEKRSMDYLDVQVFRWWFEALLGMKVEVFRNVYLGWNIRSKFLLKEEEPGSIHPYFIPGYGLARSGNWAFNYTIAYSF